MNFSIIFPTRNRTNLLKNLLESIDNTTGYKALTEVLIAVDDDDVDTQGFIKDYLNNNYLDGKAHVDVNMHIVPRSLNFSRDYYTHLAKQSNGKWIIVCNDDAEFETPCWDIAGKEILEEYTKEANIVLGWIEDHLGQNRLSHLGNYCCFPLIGREGFEALGYIFPERIPTWGADIWINSLYNGIDRIVKMPMVIKHISHHNGLRERDELNTRIGMNQVPIDMKPKYTEINKLNAILSQKASK